MRILDSEILSAVRVMLRVSPFLRAFCPKIHTAMLWSTISPPTERSRWIFDRSGADISEVTTFWTVRGVNTPTVFFVIIFYFMSSFRAWVGEVIVGTMPLQNHSSQHWREISSIVNPARQKEWYNSQLKNTSRGFTTASGVMPLLAIWALSSLRTWQHSIWLVNKKIYEIRGRPICLAVECGVVKRYNVLVLFNNKLGSQWQSKI